MKYLRLKKGCQNSPSTRRPGKRPLAVTGAYGTGPISRFWRDRNGATALEFAFVAPLFVILLTGIVQFGGIYFLQNQMTSVAQDTARRVAIGDISTVEAQTYAQDRLTNWGITFTIVATEPANDVSVDISAPLADAALMDILGLFQSGTLRATVVTRNFD